jgi:2-polyprenyl-3-methyl-5-hydroxy-6-metoxy-1,4-benzoquinol methylase
VKAVGSLWQMLIVRIRMFGKRSRHDAALATQVEYFASRRPVRIQPMDTPYVRRHFDELVRACRLGEGEAVCEWGAGLGRFSRLAVEHGAALTAIELSPTLANECRENLAHEARARVEAGDVLAVLERSDEPFDLMLGFFVLHHLPEVPAYLTATARRLKPGGRAAFAEPNPYNPLYPVQIGLTPGMRFRGEAGIYRLTPRAIERAARAAGFSRVTIRRYGALPRAPYNLLAKIGCERLLEALTPEPLRPFQTIVAWK